MTVEIKYEGDKIISVVRKICACIDFPIFLFFIHFHHIEHFYQVPNATPIAGIDYVRNKTKKVAWLVSNCSPANRRREYAYELSKYITVDIYGKCGTKKCPKNKCINWIAEHYKFYLAFENSNCKDYITEKFFHNGLRCSSAINTIVCES